MTIIGKEVLIKMDRPLGSYHPEYPDMYYPVNYGYVDGIMGGDGEEQDVYLLGVDKPVEEYRAAVLARIKRRDDVEEKWVAAPRGMRFSKEEIRQQTFFQEQYFASEIYLE